MPLKNCRFWPQNKTEKYVVFQVMLSRLSLTGSEQALHHKHSRKRQYPKMWLRMCWSQEYNEI